MHLLQLAGDQIWPNFLPILALKPSTVTFLTSADPAGSYHRSLKCLHATCVRMGVGFSMEILSTPASNPTVAGCREILRDLRFDGLNLTGGTKPMSIAAYDLALRTGVPAFYLDTRRSEGPAEFLGDADPTSFARGLGNLAGIAADITVPIALKAHGFPVPESFKTPSAAWMDFSIAAARIRQDASADGEISRAIGALRHQLMNGGTAMPKKAELRKVLQRPISADAGSPWDDYLCAASGAGLIQEIESSSAGVREFLLLSEDPGTTSADLLRSLADRTFKLLEGIWFELALMDRFRREAAFSDICWSVEGDHRQESNATSRGETDLVGFDSKRLALHFISCKTTGPHGAALDHIRVSAAAPPRKAAGSPKPSSGFSAPKLTSNARKSKPTA